MKLSVRQKLLLGGALLVLLAVLATAALLGYGSVSSGEETLRKEAENKLTAVREVKRSQIEDYFNNLIANTRGFAASTTVIEAVRGLAPAAAAVTKDLKLTQEQLAANRKALETFYVGDFLNEYKKRNAGASTDMAAVLQRADDVTATLQHLYVKANPNPLGEKNKLNQSPDASTYSKLHAQFHPALEEFRKQLGFYDVFLVDGDGRVVYTAFKELDFMTSLNDGVSAKTPLGDTWRAMKAAKRGDIYLSDYAPYLISYNDQASFVGTPVFDGDKQIGTLLFQIPIDQITRVMSYDKKWTSAGLGASGETYLIGSDGTMKSDSRFLLENKKQFVEAIRGKQVDTVVNQIDQRGTTIGLLRVNTEGAKNAASGQSGFGEYTDYRNEPVLGAYSAVSLPGLKWGILAEIGSAEALQPAADLRSQILRYALLGGLGTLLLGGLGVYVMGSRFLKPIEQLSATVRKISDGDYSARARLTGGDEIGKLGGQFDQMLDDRVASLTQAQQENERLNDSIVELLQAVFQLSQRDLTAKVPVKEDVTGSLADALNAMASETANTMHAVTDAAVQVEGASGRVRKQADEVILLASQERQEVDRTAEALRQASAAMQQIEALAADSTKAAENAARATRAAQTTVRGSVEGMENIRETIRESEKRMKRLSERSQEISTVVSLISTIAERTHVLAINANMQAAMAGEAGRGFAVVAAEVQSLAENVRQATQQIAQLVSNVQIDTADAIATMNNTVAQVVEGSRLAQRAGEQMNETQAATGALVDYVARIDTNAREQAKVSAELVERAEAIRNTTQKTGAQLAAQARETRVLVEQADKLKQAVSVFTLPERTSL